MATRQRPGSRPHGSSLDHQHDRPYREAKKPDPFPSPTLPASQLTEMVCFETSKRPWPRMFRLPKRPSQPKAAAGASQWDEKKRQVRNNRVGVMGTHGLVCFEHIRSTLIFSLSFYSMLL